MGFQLMASVKDDQRYQEIMAQMDTYFLFGSIEYVFSLIATYLLFVKWVGPAVMKNRQPMELRTPMIVYNLAMVVINTYIFSQLFFRGWIHYSWRCEPLDTSGSEDAQKILEACWLFHVTKFVEFLDTIFFVLRKKQSQVSKLHVFHHAIVPICSYYTKFHPGGWNTIFHMINSFVHIWMYLYYGLAAVGPELQKYLWWKKYLTSLQLIQFSIVFVFLMNVTLFPVEGCRVFPTLFFMNFGLAVVFLILFANFYFHTYSNMKSSNAIRRDR